MTSLRLVMSYCSNLFFAAKLTKIEDALCLGTMRGCGHRLLNGNQTKIVKALTCYLCPKDQLSCMQGCYAACAIARMVSRQWFQIKIIEPKVEKRCHGQI